MGRTEPTHEKKAHLCFSYQSVHHGPWFELTRCISATHKSILLFQSVVMIRCCHLPLQICAAFLLQQSKLNTTFLYSGFFGFTALTQSPHPAAVPVRAARSRQAETSIRMQVRTSGSGPKKPCSVRSTCVRPQTASQNLVRTSSLLQIPEEP